MISVGGLYVFFLASTLVSDPPAMRLSAADTVAAFRAAGFRRIGKTWRSCEDPSAAYSPGTMEVIADLNGDKLPEAIITEGSSFCYGNSETGYVLVSKNSKGTWQKITAGQGMVKPLATRGQDNWPDLEIGGPGFCFSVQRWNGTAYVLNRYEYEGKRCRFRR